MQINPHCSRVNCSLFSNSAQLADPASPSVQTRGSALAKLSARPDLILLVTGTRTSCQWVRPTQSYLTRVPLRKHSSRSSTCALVTLVYTWQLQPTCSRLPSPWKRTWSEFSPEVSHTEENQKERNGFSPFLTSWPSLSSDFSLPPLPVGGWVQNNLTTTALTLPMTTSQGKTRVVVNNSRCHHSHTELKNNKEKWSQDK